MTTKLLTGMFLSVGLLLPAAAPASAASLTRIETRPFYGAVVTEEEGVRVFRPLPPHRHVIINPEGRTPLNLTIEDRNVVVHHNYAAPADIGAEGAGRFVGGYGAYLPRHRGERTHMRRDTSRGVGHIIHVPSHIPGPARSKR